MPSKPPHRLTTPTLIRRLSWAGMTAEADDGTEYVAVALLAPLDVVEALVTRLADDGGVTKAHKQVGADVLTALSETYSEGDFGDWPFGDDVALPESDEDGDDDDAGDPDELDPESDFDLDADGGWDNDID